MARYCAIMGVWAAEGALATASAGSSMGSRAGLRPEGLAQRSAIIVAWRWRPPTVAIVGVLQGCTAPLATMRGSGRDNAGRRGDVGQQGRIRGGARASAGLPQGDLQRRQLCGGQGATGGHG